MSITKNRFGLFAALQPAELRNSPSNEAMAELDQFVEAHHRQLLKKADVLTRAKLLGSFHRIKPKPPKTENYLRTFIKDFENDPKFTETVALYNEKLAAYQRAKTMAAEDSLTASKRITEAPKLTPQELDWQQLLETLKRCVNNRSTEDALSWHPRHNKNYYLAKFRVQWQRYEANYGAVVLTNFSETLAHGIAEDRRQTVIGKHVEAMQSLMEQKMDYTPTTLANQKEKLEHEKLANLEEINILIPEFIEYAVDVIGFAQQPANTEVQHIFFEAILETERQERAVASNPALFNLAVGSRHKNHALATLDKIDETNEMQTFRAIFTAESATIAAALEEDNVFN